jgi:hypothetical protein
MIKVTLVTPDGLEEIEQELHIVFGEELKNVIPSEIKVNGVNYKVTSELKNFSLKACTSYDTPLGNLAFYIRHWQEYQESGALSKLTRPRIYGTFDVDVEDAQYCMRTLSLTFDTTDYDYDPTTRELKFTGSLVFVENK